MTVLIIEDEKLAANKLKKLLLTIDNSIIVLDILETIEHTVNWLRTNPSPDLIFMDIQLSDGICFEIFSIIKIKAPVIFATAYDKYAIKAFKVNSIDYLLKPIDLDALSGALNKYKSFFLPKSPDEGQMKKIYDEFLKGYKTRFLVRIGPLYNSVSTEEIICFYIVGHFVFLKTTAGKSYALDYSLQQIQNMVSPKQFFRISRKYIVNIHAIVNVLSYSTNKLKIKLKNSQDDEMIVSREKIMEFKEWLDQ